MELEERFYTSTEVAEILGVSLRSIYRYLEEGKLDAEVKTATGRHRFTKGNILDFLYPKDGIKSEVVFEPRVSTPTQMEALSGTATVVTSNQMVNNDNSQNSATGTMEEISMPVMNNIPIAGQPADLQPDQPTANSDFAQVYQGTSNNIQNTVSDQSNTTQSSEHVELTSDARDLSEIAANDVDVDLPQISDSDMVASAMSQQPASSFAGTSGTSDTDDTSDEEHTEADVDLTVDEAPVDWLAKFRAAAQRHKERQAAEMAQMAQESKVESYEDRYQSNQYDTASAQADVPSSQTPPQHVSTQSSFQTQPTSQQNTDNVQRNYTDQPSPAAIPQERVVPVRDNTVEKEENVDIAQPSVLVDKLSDYTENKIEHAEPASPFNYYRSAVGGLKDIAQSLDKSAKKASVSYAFTMNAGLSLHKPIRPFSLLHAYVKPQDKAFFENMLQLTPSSANNAQLCLITNADNALYLNVKEMHGLNVVSDVQLRRDLMENGEEELAQEFDNFVA